MNRQKNGAEFFAFRMLHTSDSIKEPKMIAKYPWMSLVFDWALTGKRLSDIREISGRSTGRILSLSNFFFLRLSLATCQEHFIFIFISSSQEFFISSNFFYYHCKLLIVGIHFRYFKEILIKIQLFPTCFSSTSRLVLCESCRKPGKFKSL